VAEFLASVAEALVTVVIVVAGLVALALGLLSSPEARRRGGAERSTWPARVGVDPSAPTDAAIEARVARMAAMGMLPPGWSTRDAARLLRVHARRARPVL
jgi:hypothetical protein